MKTALWRVGPAHSQTPLHVGIRNLHPVLRGEVRISGHEILIAYGEVYHNSVNDVRIATGSHGRLRQAMRMIAFVASAVGKTMVNVPAVEVLSAPKSSTTTVGFVRPADEVVFGVVL